MLSYDTWQTRFGGDPQVVGRMVSLNGHAYRVLGVTERGFYGPELEHRIDLQIPATRVGDFMPSFVGRADMNWVTSLYWLSPMARLKPGFTISQAQGQLQNLYRQLQREASGGKDIREHSTLRLADGSTGLEYMRSRFTKPITILMAVVMLVLAVACANLANLLLARSSTRGKEFAVRLSLGSSRARLVRQLLIESLLLAFCGGALGVALSFWITNTLLAFLNGGQPSAYALRVAPDLMVFCFSFSLTLFTAVLFGLVPAWQSTRPNLLPSLKEESRGASGPFQRALFHKSLVVAQIALSLVVLFAAGLLTRTLRGLQTVKLGFDKEKLIVLSVNPAASGHSAAETADIYHQILQRASILPGVQAGSLSLHAPLRPMNMARGIEVPGYTKQEVSKATALNYVSEGYFLTLNQPLLRGRDFSDADTKGTRPVAIINQKFADHYFAGQSPVGQHLLESGKDVEIVGVAANLHDGDLRSSVQETVYMPEKQVYTSSLTLLLRTRTDPKQVVPSLLGIIRNIDRRMPVFSVRTLDAQVGAELSSERILSYLSGLFAALATLLTGVGLYGVMAYAVTRRTREIGVRFAIGAQRRDIARLFLRESLIVIAAGVIVGVPLALVSVTVLKSLLFGLTATDVPTLLVSAGVLMIAGVAATALPLRKATYTDPVCALRYE